MVVVAQGNNWWIESFTVTRLSVANGAQQGTTHTLERSGVFLGGSTTLDHAAAATVGSVSTALRNTDNTQLSIGENLTAIQSIMSNDSGGALTIGVIVIVFLRKP